MTDCAEYDPERSWWPTCPSFCILALLNLARTFFLMNGWKTNIRAGKSSLFTGHTAHIAFPDFRDGTPVEPDGSRLLESTTGESDHTMLCMLTGLCLRRSQQSSAAVRWLPAARSLNGRTRHILRHQRFINFSGFLYVHDSTQNGTAADRCRLPRFQSRRRQPRCGLAVTVLESSRWFSRVLARMTRAL